MSKPGRANSLEVFPGVLILRSEGFDHLAPGLGCAFDRIGVAILIARECWVVHIGWPLKSFLAIVRFDGCSVSIARLAQTE